MLSFIFVICSVVWGQTDSRQSYLRWTAQLQTIDHPEPNYRYLSEIYTEISSAMLETGHIIEPLRVGKTVENRTIWGFKINPIKPNIIRFLY